MKILEQPVSIQNLLVLTKKKLYLISIEMCALYSFLSFFMHRLVAFNKADWLRFLSKYRWRKAKIDVYLFQT